MATAGAAFGLLAIWAALGRLHWFDPVHSGRGGDRRLVPCAGFRSGPGVRFAGPGRGRAVDARSPIQTAAGRRNSDLNAARPPTRGGDSPLADLFRATLLIAAVFGVAAYLPGDIRASWWKYVLLGTGFGMATLAGTWAALAHRPWWIRWRVVCIAAPLAGVPTALDGELTSISGSRVALVCRHGGSGCAGRRMALVSAGGGINGFTSHRSRSVRGRRKVRRVGAFRRRLAGIIVGLASLAILLLPAAAYHDMLHAPLISTCPPPEPNAYDDLLRIAAALRKP